MRPHFLYQILLIRLADNCTEMCWFMFYLLHIRQTGENANFRNKFCSFTDSTYY